MDELEALHSEIHACRKCDAQGLAMVHPSVQLARGKPSRIMVIGIAPGATEHSSGRAFSGQAGKRLVQWLIQGGIGSTEEQIRDRCYFTSILKCGGYKQPPVQAIRNCSGFLDRQLRIVNADILITLGDLPLSSLFGITGKLETFVGKAFAEEDLSGALLFKRLSPVTRILPLPHPSGQNNGWIHKYEHLLNSALGQLKTLYFSAMKRNAIK